MPDLSNLFKNSQSNLCCVRPLYSKTDTLSFHALRPGLYSRLVRGPRPPCARGKKIQLKLGSDTGVTVRIFFCIPLCASTCSPSSIQPYFIHTIKNVRLLLKTYIKIVSAFSKAAFFKNQYLG